MIDATDCPVKAEIYRLAQRYGLQVVLVSANDIGAPFEPWITKVVAGAGAEAETIANEASATDFVVTDNKELAALLLAKGTVAYTGRGQIWTENGPHPYLPDTVRSNNRARFESVFGDALSAKMKAKI